MTSCAIFSNSMLNKKRRQLIHAHLKYGRPTLREIVKELSMNNPQNVYTLIKEYARELVWKR